MAIECAPGITPAVCPSGQVCRPCDPPSLPQLEIVGARAIGLVWVFAGVAFFGLFVYNGYLYMFNRIEDSKKRMIQWIIGLLMILFSQPLVATVMGTLLAPDNNCYQELQGVNLTFFFPNACTAPTTAP
jgi:hypothetical protein